MNKYEAVYHFTLYRGEHTLDQVKPAALRADPEVVKAACTHGKGLARNLMHAAESLRQDKAFALALAEVNDDPSALQYMSDALRDDKDVVMAFVSRYAGGRNLEHASERLRADNDVLRAALGSDGLALAHVPDKQRSDRQWIDIAYGSKTGAVQHVPPRLLKDRDFVLDFVTENNAKDGILQYLPAYADDREVVLEILTHDAPSLQYASEALRADPEVVMHAMFRPSLNYVPAMGFEFASLALRQDKEFAKQAIARLKGYRPDYRAAATAAIKDVQRIALASQKGVAAAEVTTLKTELRKILKALKDTPNSPYVVEQQTRNLVGFKDRLVACNDNAALMAALAEVDYARSKFYAKDRGDWMGLASAKLMNDRKFLAKVMEVTEGQALTHLGPQWQADADFILENIGPNSPPEAIPSALREDPGFVLGLLGRVQFVGQIEKVAAPGLWTDREFVLAIVARDGYFLSAASADLRADREVVSTAVARTASALRYADKSFFSDRDFMRAALVAGSEEAAAGLAEPLVSDIDFLLECLGAAANERIGMPRRLIAQVPRKVRSDKRFLVACLKRNGWCIENVPEALRYDPEVLKAAFSSRMAVWKELDLEKLRSLFPQNELAQIVSDPAVLKEILGD
jgi:hypothetical protein